MCDDRRGLDWWMDLLTTYTLTTRNYTLQITDTHRLVFSVSNSRFLAKDFETGIIITVSQNYIRQISHIKAFLRSLPYRTEISTMSLAYRQGPHRKHNFSIVAFVSVAAGTCLQSRCPKTAAAQTIENTVVLFLLACMLRELPSNGPCLQSHLLATGLYAIAYRQDM
jgi:hypothetical protein